MYRLHNSLQLACIAQGILDDHLAQLLLLLAALVTRLGGSRRRREENVAVLNGPVSGTGKVDDCALGVEEEEGFGGGEREGGVGALGARGDFGADLGGEDLNWWFVRFLL